MPITLNADIGRWKAEILIPNYIIATSTWGTPNYPAKDLIKSILENRQIKVTKDGPRGPDGRPTRVFDADATAAAMQKADEIKQAFVDWIWNDDTRRDLLSKIYNDKFNTHVVPYYDGSHLTLEGSSSDIQLKPHQKDAIWRSIQEGTILLDHRVGAGKTFVCVASIMESRRMGVLQKPMLVVPNHLVYQWRDDFFKLYPGANILVAEKNDFQKKNRDKLFSTIATGEWDAIIVPHSSFKKLAMPEDALKEILTEQVEGLTEAIQAARAIKSDGKNYTVKELEKTKERMATKLEALQGSGPKDKSVDFADLGVDALYVDESHEFKNLFISTNMQVSGLGNVRGSEKAFDLFIKCRFLQRKYNGKGVYFATGTPISNSIAEVFTLQRYMQYQALENKGIHNFDAWAATFGQITEGWELDSTGVNYTLKSRFAKFQNVPELLSMYRSFADVVVEQDLRDQAKAAGLRYPIPELEGGKPTNIIAPRSPMQADYMNKIIYRMDHLPKDNRIDNPLKITNDARKAGLDYRLINPEADDFEDSKINLAVKNIFTVWYESKDIGGTQLVFCDLSTPKAGNKNSNEEALENKTNPPVVENELLEKDPDDEEDIVVDMDFLIANNSKFSVYDDLKNKLIKKGIPAQEIAFIHDANTDQRKSKMFQDMQNGRVRILLGSTAKLGAGTNVQKRLVAQHDLDAPWRPSDLEQRFGRISRPGNMFFENDSNFKIKVFRYATEKTYDARMWQTIEYKAAAIEQFRKGDILQRVIDDVSNDAANAAEMKAAASGNPLILEQVQAAANLRKLEALFINHQRTQHRLKSRISWLIDAPHRFAEIENTYLADKNHIKEHRKEKFEFVDKKGQKLNEKQRQNIMDDIAFSVQSIAKAGGLNRDDFFIGSYHGVNIFVRESGPEGYSFKLSTPNKSYMSSTLRYKFGEQFSLNGFFQRVDNFLNAGLQKEFETNKESLVKNLEELKSAEHLLGQPFAQIDLLQETRERNAEILRQLQILTDSKKTHNHNADHSVESDSIQNTEVGDPEKKSLKHSKVQVIKVC